MSTCIPCLRNSVAPASRGKMVNPGRGAVGVFRLPSDPLFYANLTLQNIVVGSRYRVVWADDETVELASGVAGATEETLTGLAAYANPMLVKVTARKGTSAPKYIPHDTYGYLTKSGGSVYLAQQPDPIA